MMHFFSRSHPSLGIAPLTVGVGSIVSIADALPGASVFFMDVRGSFILVILSPFLYSMLFAVLSVCKLGTAGVSTRSFRFRWHLFTSVPGIGEAPEESLPRRLNRIILCYHNNTGKSAMLCQSVPTLRWNHKVFQSRCVDAVDCPIPHSPHHTRR